MSEPFLAEVRILGFNFAPRGWAMCDGQMLPINQNQSLYSLLGTTYGGDGRTDFALPELRGRTPIHVGSSNGSSHSLGEKSGEETRTLSIAEMPAHDHALRASSDTATTPIPAAPPPAAANVLASSAPNEAYAPPQNLTEMRSDSIASAGGSHGHENMQPYLTLTFVIALTGLFPSRN